MDILTILYTIFIQPLQLVFEIIFNTANKFTNHPGLSIIVLSLLMNFLVLPLYKRADDMQEKQRNIDLKLKKGVDHIKKSFSGDERMMILQTYYKQNNYKPTDALNGSISLLLEIPFFIAAYQFLSHLTILEGVSLGPISDLSKPDSFLVIAGFTINVLPVLMTLINVISSAIYLKGFPLKTKIQLYAMAFFFLVFLYESPSGLVFYWTLNNVFSLFKNVFYKFKNPRKVLNYLLSFLGISVILFDLIFYKSNVLENKVFLIVFGIMLNLPLFVNLIKNIFVNKPKNIDKSYLKNVILSGLLISVILGLYIPSSVISSSPEEFISITYFHNPLLYLVYTYSLSFGFFVVWVGVFYWISNCSFKLIIEKILILLLVITIVNYMFFGTSLGNLLPNLQYEEGLVFKNTELIINSLVMILITILVFTFINRFKKQLTSILMVVFLAFSSLSIYNINNINTIVNDYVSKTSSIIENKPYFNLSKNGKNVIILLMDRALNSNVPYIFQEKPELKKQFEGFTYYNNTISYGGYTNFGTPAVFGGYEYTPAELNKRSNEKLVDKHNESLKVLPKLYSEHGYKVTVMDPSYANYTWIPDLSIYNEFTNINTFITEGRFSNKLDEVENINNNYRNFFLFSFMKSMPLLIQNSIYDEGNYNKVLEKNVSNGGNIDYSVQTVHSNTTSSGIYNSFMKAYNVLLNLDSITSITDTNENTFLMMVNNTTHNPMLLQTPNYEPKMFVDNNKYSLENNNHTIDGKSLRLENTNQIIHYHANMATFIQLGKWFDYMRENKVYDNTKIILVADHGRALRQIDDLILGDEDSKNVELYYPLLMVKDFNSTGFKVSDEFMTNADVPTIALDETIDNPINPYTGNMITNSNKNNMKHYIIRSNEWHTSKNNGNTFLPSKWAVVKDNIWNRDNWEFIDEELVNPE